MPIDSKPLTYNNQQSPQSPNTAVSISTITVSPNQPTVNSDMPSTNLTSSTSTISKEMILDHGTCEPVDEEPLYTGKVLQLTRFHYRDGAGKDRYWEGVDKVKKFKNAYKAGTENSTGLVTIAILCRRVMCDCLILVKQFRAQLKSYTLEFPATVMDINGDPEETAHKEIEDDTGYTSTAIKIISPPTSVDPVVSSAKVSLVSVMIDGDDPLQNPSPKNSEFENEHANSAHGRIVEVLQVPVNGLLDRLAKFAEEGVIVDSLVYSFAIGLKHGERNTMTMAKPRPAET